MTLKPLGRWPVTRAASEEPQLLVRRRPGDRRRAAEATTRRPTENRLNQVAIRAPSLAVCLSRQQRRRRRAAPTAPPAEISQAAAESKSASAASRRRAAESLSANRNQPVFPRRDEMRPPTHARHAPSCPRAHARAACCYLTSTANRRRHAIAGSPCAHESILMERVKAATATRRYTSARRFDAMISWRARIGDGDVAGERLRRHPQPDGDAAHPHRPSADAAVASRPLLLKHHRHKTLQATNQAVSTRMSAVPRPRAISRGGNKKLRSHRPITRVDFSRAIGRGRPPISPPEARVADRPSSRPAARQPRHARAGG